MRRGSRPSSNPSLHLSHEFRLNFPPFPRHRSMHSPTVGWALRHLDGDALPEGTHSASMPQPICPEIISPTSRTTPTPEPTSPVGTRGPVSVLLFEFLSHAMYNTRDTPTRTQCIVHHRALNHGRCTIPALGPSEPFAWRRASQLPTLTPEAMPQTLTPIP